MRRPGLHLGVRGSRKVEREPSRLEALAVELDQVGAELRRMRHERDAALRERELALEARDTANEKLVSVGVVVARAHKVLSMRAPSPMSLGGIFASYVDELAAILEPGKGGAPM